MIIANDNLYEYALYPVLFFQNKVCFGHEGKIDGFHSYAIYFPSDSMGLSFGANADLGYLNEILIRGLHAFNQINSNERIYANGNEKIELIKLNSILLLNINVGPYVLLEKSKKGIFESPKDQLAIKLDKDANRLSLIRDKIKTSFEKKQNDLPHNVNMH